MKAGKAAGLIDQHSWHGWVLELTARLQNLYSVTADTNLSNELLLSKCRAVSWYKHTYNFYPSQKENIAFYPVPKFATLPNSSRELEFHQNRK
jgi:hypothetical protein